MKKTAKTLSILLALVMVICLATSAFAAEPTHISTIGKDGALVGMNDDATNVTYLSDLHDSEDSLKLNDYVVAQVNNKILLNQNYNGSLFVFVENGARKQIKGHSETDANGNRTFTLSDGSTVTYNQNEIALGYNGTKYAKGLGVHPNAVGSEDRYIVYDVSDLNATNFYAVAGATGSVITNPSSTERKVTFELWGSTAETYSENAEFVKLAYADDVRAYLVAEFDVDITGYNYIKLVVKMSDGSTNNDTCGVAWGNASVYSLASDSSDATQGTTGSTSATTGGSSAAGDDNAKTADSFTGLVIALALLSAGAIVTLTTNRKKF